MNITADRDIIEGHALGFLRVFVIFLNHCEDATKFESSQRKVIRSGGNWTLKSLRDDLVDGNFRFNNVNYAK